MAKRKTKTPKVPPSLPPVQQGFLSPKRGVPSAITRPPYALSGDPGPSILPLVRTSDEITSMRKAGAIAAEVLLHVGEKVTPGITTDKLDQIAHDGNRPARRLPKPTQLPRLPQIRLYLRK